MKLLIKAYWNLNDNDWTNSEVTNLHKLLIQKPWTDEFSDFIATMDCEYVSKPFMGYTGKSICAERRGITEVTFVPKPSKYVQDCATVALYRPIGYPFQAAIYHEVGSFLVNHFTMSVNSFQYDSFAGKTFHDLQVFPKQEVVEKVKRCLKQKLVITWAGDQDFLCLGLKQSDFQNFDLSRFYKRIDGMPYKLKDVYSAFFSPDSIQDGSHDALEDAKATFRIFQEHFLPTIKNFWIARNEISDWYFEHGTPNVHKNTQLFLKHRKFGKDIHLSRADKVVAILKKLDSNTSLSSFWKSLETHSGETQAFNGEILSIGTQTLNSETHSRGIQTINGETNSAETQTFNSEKHSNATQTINGETNSAETQTPNGETQSTVGLTQNNSSHRNDEKQMSYVPARKRKCTGKAGSRKQKILRIEPGLTKLEAKFNSREEYGKDNAKCWLNFQEQEKKNIVTRGAHACFFCSEFVKSDFKTIVFSGFSNTQNLNVHINKHLKNPQYECKPCGKVFDRKDRLEKHHSKCTSTC